MDTYKILLIILIMYMIYNINNTLIEPLSHKHDHVPAPNKIKLTFNNLMHLLKGDKKENEYSTIYSRLYASDKCKPKIYHRHGRKVKLCDCQGAGGGVYAAGFFNRGKCSSYDLTSF